MSREAGLLLTGVAVLSLACGSCFRTETEREIVAGWTSVPYQPLEDREREEMEFSLRELIFRQEIAEPVRDEIVFLSFGYADDGNWIEPPDGYLDRFADLSVDVRPVSDAKLLLGGLESKTDGRIGHIYYVQVVEWLDDNTVKIDHGLYGGPLYGGGVDGAIYEYDNGSWRLKTAGQGHIS